MRRRLFILLFVLAAAASCVRNEPLLRESADRIWFQTPLLGGPSKAILTGTTYPTSESFTVWGFFSQNANDMPVPGPTAINYIDGAECAYIDSKWVPFYPDADGLGNRGYYYWKAGVGYMTFHALSPRSVVHSHDWQSGFTIEDYTVGTEDILYSHFHQSEHTVSGVDIRFYHALSIVKFIVREADNYTGDNTITVKKVELMDAYQTATFAENRASGALNSYSSEPTWTPDTHSEHVYTIYEDNTGTVLTWDNGQPVDAILGSPLLVIPQVLDHSADGNSKVAVRITYSSGGNSKTVSGTLAGLRISGGESIVSSWDMARRYTYVIVVGQHKISFSPVVENWTAGSEDVFIIPE